VVCPVYVSTDTILASIWMAGRFYSQLACENLFVINRRIVNSNNLRPKMEAIQITNFSKAVVYGDSDPKENCREKMTCALWAKIVTQTVRVISCAICGQQWSANEQSISFSRQCTQGNCIWDISASLVWRILLFFGMHWPTMLCEAAVVSNVSWSRSVRYNVVY
jgi:hypothetical protein